MKSKPRKQFTPEFKAQAVALLQTGKPVSQLAQELGISDNLLYSWRLASQRAQGGSEEPQAAGARDAADELRALRREMARLKMENDILKKAAVILGTSHRPDSAP
jgi:transposase-like protein